MLLQTKEICKSYGVKTVVDGVSFIVEDREKVAVVGVNGAGKTTLFRILTGEETADSGEVVFAKDSRIGYLTQVSDLNEEYTVFEELMTVFAGLVEIETKMRDIETLMATQTGDALDALMSSYSKLTHDYEAQNGYEYKSRIRGVVAGLGFAEMTSTQKIKTFSGGQKTRISLAKLLLQEPDLLLLDEPTNHLDIKAIEWLEDFLRNYSKAIVLISHDRYFLDKIVTKVIEIENTKCLIYSGNYSSFAAKKEINRDIQLKHFVNQQRDIKRQEEVIRVLKSYNKEKSVKRAESREKMLDKVERIEKPSALPANMKLVFRRAVKAETTF